MTSIDILTGAAFRYLTVAEALREWILSGNLPTLARLPSVRNAMTQFGVSRNTVLAAYAVLEAQGLVSVQHRSGYYVRPPSDDLSKPIARLQSNLPDALVNESGRRILGDISALGPRLVANLSSPTLHYDLLPKSALQKAMRQVSMTRLKDSLLPDFGAGYVPFRQAIAQFYGRYGLSVNPDHVIVTSGGSAAIATCIRTKSKPGDHVAVQSPAFYTILPMLSSMDRRIVEIPSGPEGIDIGELDRAASTWPIKTLIVTANFSSPMNAIMTPQSKRLLLDVCKRHGISVIEDDVLGHLAPPASGLLPLKAYDDCENVLLCSSVSKTMGAGLRLGWCITGPRSTSAILSQRSSAAPAMPVFWQAVAGEIINNNKYHLHLSKLRKNLKQNANLIDKMIKQSFPRGSVISNLHHGYFSWIRLPQDVSAWDFYKFASARGVIFTPGSIYSMNDGFDHHIRMTTAVPSAVIAAATTALMD